MIHMFDQENKFWSLIGKLADVTILSILWFICCLPIITIGAATTSFYRYVILLINDVEGALWQSFFAGIRKSFRKASILWAIQVAGCAFLAFDFWLGLQMYQLTKGSVAAIALLGLLGCIGILFCSTFLYAYPILAIYDFPLKKTISDAFLMAIANLPVTFVLWLLCAGSAVLFYYYSGFACFIFGLFVFLSAYFFISVFRKYTGEQAMEDALHAERKEEKRKRKASARLSKKRSD